MQFTSEAQNENKELNLLDLTLRICHNRGEFNIFRKRSVISLFIIIFDFSHISITGTVFFYLVEKNSFMFILLPRIYIKQLS